MCSISYRSSINSSSIVFVWRKIKEKSSKRDDDDDTNNNNWRRRMETATSKQTNSFQYPRQFPTAESNYISFRYSWSYAMHAIEHYVSILFPVRKMSNITIYTFRATVSNCKRIKKTSGIMYPQFICVILLFCRTLGDCGWCCCCHRWRSHSLAVHSSIHQNILWHRTYRNTPHTHQHNNPNEMRTREWERERECL